MLREALARNEVAQKKEEGIRLKKREDLGVDLVLNGKAIEMCLVVNRYKSYPVSGQNMTKRGRDTARIKISSGNPIRQ